MPPEPPANPYLLAAAPVPGYAEAGLLANPYVLAATSNAGYVELSMFGSVKKIVYNGWGTKTINPNSTHAQERRTAVIARSTAAAESTHRAASTSRMQGVEDKPRVTPRRNQQRPRKLPKQ